VRPLHNLPKVRGTLTPLSHGFLPCLAFTRNVMQRSHEIKSNEFDGENRVSFRKNATTHHGYSPVLGGSYQLGGC